MAFGVSGRAADGRSWPRGTGEVSPESGQLSPEFGQLSPDVAPDWLERLAAFLRRLHPFKTAEAVAAQCRGQVSAEQVRKWLALRSAPGGVAMICLASAYGPQLMLALYGPSPIGRPGWLELALKAMRVDEMEQRLVALRLDCDRELGRG